MSIDIEKDLMEGLKNAKGILEGMGIDMSEMLDSMEEVGLDEMANSMDMDKFVRDMKMDILLRMMAIVFPIVVKEHLNLFDVGGLPATSASEYIEHFLDAWSKTQKDALSVAAVAMHMGDGEAYQKVAGPAVDVFTASASSMMNATLSSLEDYK